MLVFKTSNQATYKHIKKVKSGPNYLVPLQKLVGGSLEGLPHGKYEKAPFVAYANGNGMNEDLPSNYLAFGVLRHLGFLDSTAGLAFYFGNVILMRQDRKPLTEEDIKLVDAALAAYRKEIKNCLYS
jgi:hypothetical protein